MKAMTKAQKRRGKKAARHQQDNGLPEIAPVTRRKKQGSARMTEIRQHQGADIAMLEARARKAGIALVEVDNSPLPDGEAERKAARKARHAASMARGRQLRELRAPWYGCNAGRAMLGAIQREDDRQDLWSAICHMRRVQAAYDAAIIAPHRHAQCLRLLLPLDEMHADAASPPLDLRTDADKQRQAVSAWMQMQGWLDHAKDGAGHCKAVVIDDADCKDPLGMVRALWCVVDGLKGRRILGSVSV